MNSESIHYQFSTNRAIHIRVAIGGVRGNTGTISKELSDSVGVRPTIDVPGRAGLTRGRVLCTKSLRRFIAKCPRYPTLPLYKLWNKCCHIYRWRVANRGCLLRVVIINLGVRWRIWIICNWNLLPAGPRINSLKRRHMWHCFSCELWLSVWTYISTN